MTIQFLNCKLEPPILLLATGEEKLTVGDGMIMASAQRTQCLMMKLSLKIQVKFQK